MPTNLKYFLRFLLFLLLQIFLFDRLSLGIYLYPCPYILFLLLFPFSYRTAPLLLWGFAIGIGIDMGGSGLLGLHTSAALVLALIHKGVLHSLYTKEAFDNIAVPSIRTLGWSRFIAYVGFCVLIHHVVFFSLESYMPRFWGQNILRLLCSGAFNIVFITLLSFLFVPLRRNK